MFGAGGGNGHYLTAAGWPRASFMSPPGSNKEYLFAGAIWVGGILNGDTLVSVGYDGWQIIREMNPPGRPPQPSISRIDYLSDFTMRALFTDTIAPSDSPYGPFPFQPYDPMYLRISSRSHVIRNELYEMIILYDIVITNVGRDTIKDACVGFYFDSDVGIYPNAEIHSDDIAGSIPELKIGYIIDNDGDPENGIYTDNSVIRAFAAKILRTSFAPSSNNFNWWVSNLEPLRDYGPRQCGTIEYPFRDFGGFLGTPEGDRNKYYIMTHPEWDFDQIRLAAPETLDSCWILPIDGGTDIANGFDARFLLSAGAQTLPPDSSLRVILTTFTTTWVHWDPNNFGRNLNKPDSFLSNLRLYGLIENSWWADFMVDSLIDPFFPVIGLSVLYHNGDSAILEWDPWVFDDINSYRLNLYELPLDSLPHPGAIPPWLKPTTPAEFYELPSFHHTLSGLTPNYPYLAAVAHMVGDRVGAESAPVLLFERHEPPTPKSEYIFVSDGEPAVLEWLPPSGIDIDHYNIYRFADSAAANTRYHRFYDKGDALGRLTPVDTVVIDDTLYFYYAMEIYARVDSGVHFFTENDIAEGAIYILTAVDKYGFESEFSRPVTTHFRTLRTRDILVLTNRSKLPALVNYDTVKNFYQSLLTGYDYQIYNLYDSLFRPPCDSTVCFHWREMMPFRLVIADDLLLNFLVRDTDVDSTLHKLCLSGGHLALFGGLQSPFWSVEEDFYGYCAFDNPLLTPFFDVDSSFVTGGYYFYNSPNPDYDSISAFLYAESTDPDIPSIAFDTTRNPFLSLLKLFWPPGTAPYASSFKIKEGAQVTHLFRSRDPGTSLQEGNPVGVITRGPAATTYLFGFHLWYMKPDQARALIDYIMNDIPLNVADTPDNLLPNNFTVSQNFPNPFNPSTVIQFELPRAADITLDIYNILGQKVITLLKERKPAGKYRVEWDGNNSDRLPCASGIYLYRLRAGDQAVTRKMVLLK
ncbi:MAG: T9SS type A sorting domain-containing protein [Candidatus Zixiibacteriota bacterium]